MKTPIKITLDKDKLLKLSKRVNREIELSINGNKWISYNKIVKNKKKYTRKEKHKKSLI